MKHALGLVLAAIIVVGGSMWAFSADPSDSAAQAAAAKSAAGKGELHHVVAFKFKESASKEQIKGVEDAFAGLKGKIREIRQLKWGTNVSPEKHDKGFTHCWVLTFASDADRDAYLVHPDHKAFGKLVGPAVADVFVVDFWSKE